MGSDEGLPCGGCDVIEQGALPLERVMAGFTVGGEAGCRVVYRLGGGIVVGVAAHAIGG